MGAIKSAAEIKANARYIQDPSNWFESGLCPIRIYSHPVVVQSSMWKELLGLDQCPQQKNNQQGGQAVNGPGD